METITHKIFDVAADIVMIILIVDTVIWFAARSYKRIRESISKARYNPSEPGDGQRQDA